VQPAHFQSLEIVLSFDVEEHFRIEAANELALDLDPSRKDYYAERLEHSTYWLLDQLAPRGIKATFFVVGQIALRHPRLVRAIADAGHEVASHSWDHQRVHNLNPTTFRQDVLRSKDALEQATGQPVRGYRAPTFSVVGQTAWALDVLAELQFAYDSSIYPVWHDRYGVPQAPRVPFRARGAEHEILEMPPATLRVLGTNLPVGGGGYFRLLPLFFMERALAQIQRHSWPSVAMLYFHPWEFDPDQFRLPLRRLSAFRTYVGISRSRGRLVSLLERHKFTRAIDVARVLGQDWSSLPAFNVAASQGQKQAAFAAPEPKSYGITHALPGKGVLTK
jgi:polysaccharide deacetylase family protein (PEP-CTERM system associated)